MSCFLSFIYLCVYFFFQPTVVKGIMSSIPRTYLFRYSSLRPGRGHSKLTSLPVIDSVA